MCKEIRDVKGFRLDSRSSPIHRHTHKAHECRSLSTPVDTALFTLHQIGVVEHGFSNEEVRGKSGLIEGLVQVFPEYAEGLKGIEEYSHIFIISLLHKEGSPVLRVKPKRLLKLGLKPDELPELGVYATDSPTRPNRIGLTLVKLLKREDNLLYVLGLDLFNGTPIIDIKPYRSDYHAQSFSMPRWVTNYAHERPSI